MKVSQTRAILIENLFIKALWCTKTVE